MVGSRDPRACFLIALSFELGAWSSDSDSWHVATLSEKSLAMSPASDRLAPRFLFWRLVGRAYKLLAPGS